VKWITGTFSGFWVDGWVPRHWQSMELVQKFLEGLMAAFWRELQTDGLRELGEFVKRIENHES
jgi:hypothetical protein